MLGLLVFRNVLKQRLLVREALVAGVTLVGLVSLVAAGVGLQVGQLGERLGAACGKNNNKKVFQFSNADRPEFLPRGPIKFN